MGCLSDKYEPPKENKINSYLKKKQTIVDNHMQNSTLPTSEEIQLVSKMDIDIFEFLTRNINFYEDTIKKTEKGNALLRLKTKLEYYKKKKEEFENINKQWDALLGYHEEVKKMEKEKEEVIKEKIEKKQIRTDIFAKEEEEEEEEEEESKSKDYYCNCPFFEENPKKVGENRDKFHSLIHSDNDEEDMKNKYPFDFV